MARHPTPTAILEQKGSFKAHPERRRDRELEPTPAGPLGDPPPHFAGTPYAALWHEVAGGILACKQVRQASARHFCDLERSGRNTEDFPFVFSAEAAERFCYFAESFQHVKGKWLRTRELIVLDGWQLFVVCSLFGWVE